MVSAPCFLLGFELSFFDPYELDLTKDMYMEVFDKFYSRANIARSKI